MHAALEPTQQPDWVLSHEGYNVLSKLIRDVALPGCKSAIPAPFCLRGEMPFYAVRTIPKIVSGFFPRLRQKRRKDHERDAPAASTFVSGRFCGCTVCLRHQTTAQNDPAKADSASLGSIR